MKKSSISNGMSAGADHHMLKNDPNFHRNRMKKPVKVAYIMSRFPELTETFVLYEMLSVEQMGIEVEVFPLLRGSTSAKTRDGASLFRKLLDLRSSGREAQLVQPEARRLVQRACYQPFLSLSILGAQIHFLRHKPKEYLSALWNLIRGTWGSLNFMLGGVSIFPKVVLFARVMESKGIHHVHAHFANHPAAAAFVIHRLTGISYSFTAHGSDLHRRKQMLRQKVAEAAFVVPISGYNKRVIEEVCGRDCSSRVEVIRCGVDRNVFFPCPNGGSMSNGAFNVLSIGKLHPVKGHIYLIDACKLLRERRMDFVCLIVGDGPDRALLQEKIAAAGLADFVHLLGPRLRTEIAEIYRGAHVLVAPSVPTSTGRREGIPVVLMEAMASGLPVVASRISGIPELVEHGENGILVPPADPRSLAGALQRLQDEPGLRVRLGNAGRMKIAAEYDLARNAALLAKRFSECAGFSGSGMQGRLPVHLNRFPRKE